MTNLEALEELAAKVQAGEYTASGDADDMWLKWHDAFSPRDWKTYNELAQAAFHGSLDAAKALHYAVLPGNWIVHGIDQDSARRWYVTLSDVTGKANTIPHTGHEDNPARAWLLAIIRALIADEEEK